jgi:predicted transcriptional regulator
LNTLEIKLEIERQKREAWQWWKTRHGGRIEIIADVSGVSRQTVRRWNRKGAVPALVAVLIEQIRHGPLIQTATFRGLPARKRTTGDPYGPGY